MVESCDDTDCSVHTDPHHVKHSNRIALAGQDHQTQSSSDHFPATFIDRPCLPLSPSPTHISSNEGSPTMASSQLAHMFTTSDNEPRDSLHALEGGQGPAPRKSKCSSYMEDHSGVDSDNYSASPPSLLEHPLSGLQSYNTAAPSSETEPYTADNPKVDSLMGNNIFKSTIPVVRDLLQGAAQGIDAYLPRDDIVVKNAPQLDARGSSFTDVGRDQHQHYHFHVTACPHASSSTTRHRAETANVTDIGLEPDTFTPLLERGYRLMISARTFIATSIAVVIAQFDL